MSATSNPIPPERFALAISDLPLSSLHAKAAEIRNSIAHLSYSNEQLQPFADDGDADCADAIRENEQVVQRMEERIQLLRAEVEGRGMRWAEGEVEDTEKIEGMRDGEGRLANGLNGHANGDGEAMEGVEENGAGAGGREEAQQQHAQSREQRLTDDELRRRLIERLGDPDEDEGVHL
ncbi:MAG: hypothetical protein M1820_002349 [Bogoriella megaspora]|nr:MAG: hypothetical protein M1820_002349 [Bogoriella megaspora]